MYFPKFTSSIKCSLTLLGSLASALVPLPKKNFAIGEGKLTYNERLGLHLRRKFTTSVPPRVFSVPTRGIFQKRSQNIQKIGFDAFITSNHTHNEETFEKNNCRRYCTMTDQIADLKPIDLYSWTTPNGRKIELALEELNMPYNYHPINISKGDQFKPEFLKISPNNKIPAIVDSNTKNGTPLSIFESGAILIYLAKKYQARANIVLLPDEESDPQAHSKVLQWLFWQVGGFGPMLGQLNHFRRYAPEKIEYALNRYSAEAKRLFSVLDKQLESTNAFIAGPNYSIADIATWTWAVLLPDLGDDFVGAYPHVSAWIERIKQRAAGAKVFAKIQAK